FLNQHGVLLQRKTLERTDRLFVADTDTQFGVSELQAEAPRCQPQSVLPGLRQQLPEFTPPPGEELTCGSTPDSRLPVLDFIFYRYSHRDISGGILHASAGHGMAGHPRCRPDEWLLLSGPIRHSARSLWRRYYTSGP